MNYYVEVTIASCHQDVTKYCLHVSTYFIDSDYIHTLSRFNLTKVRPLFKIPHRGSDNSPLLIVFSANHIDESNRNFYATEDISEALTF